MSSRATTLESFVDSLVFRIDGNYYDLTNFSDSHPGGKHILVFAKRKAWDHTQMFAIHHINYTKVSSMMNTFLIKDENMIQRIEDLIAIEVPQRFPNQLPSSSSPYYPSGLKGSGIESVYKPVDSVPSKWGWDDLRMADCSFELPQKGSFYWELREEIYKYFRTYNIDYYPTIFYMIWWWIIIALYATIYYYQYLYKGSYLLTIPMTFLHLNLGGYGHQFIHNPVFFRKYAYLSLDWIGLYSYTYMVDHIAQHHIYTNTMPDNHFDGTDPFVYTNPFTPRAYWRKIFNFFLANMTTATGIFGNYIYNWSCILRGKEPFYSSIFMYPCNWILLCYLVGDVWVGSKLMCITTFSASIWYFSIALMNHNQSENWNMDQLTKAAKSNANNGGWAEMQLVTSTDIGFNYGFIGSMFCLWLNYHTVHHLFPTVDMSHHREAQTILDRVAAKHGVTYNYKDPWTMYWEMLETFSVARAINVMREQ